LLEELDNHVDRILSITGYTESEYQQIKLFVTKNIQFIDSAAINKKDWEKSYQLLKDIDEMDTAFLALNLEINGLLWTGDKKLIKGLENKNYYKTVTTDVLYTQYLGL
jgi:predicted nucleic acid-binding protein